MEPVWTLATGLPRNDTGRTKLAEAASPITEQPGDDLGIADIDLQHRFFASLINRLAADLRQVTDAALRASLLQELSAYARFHFISEENLMARAGYPALAEHRALHNRLIDELSARQTRLRLCLAPQDVDDAITFLVQWFKGHTQHDDRTFAQYLQPAAG